jgi:hypothetical protein
MATLSEQALLSRNSHLLDRISAALAVAAETVRSEARDFVSASADDTFTATAHGYDNGDKIELAGDTLSTGVDAAVTYFICGKTDDTFKVCLADGKAALSLSTDGQGSVAVEHHPARFAWASSVLLVQTGPRAEAERAIWFVVQNATIADAYIADIALGAGASDNDIQNAINGLVNILAGVEK